VVVGHVRLSPVAAKILFPSGITVASRASRSSTGKLTLWENSAYLTVFLS
jgi:hypothetical protein